MLQKASVCNLNGSLANSRRHDRLFVASPHGQDDTDPWGAYRVGTEGFQVAWPDCSAFTLLDGVDYDQRPRIARLRTRLQSANKLFSGIAPQIELLKRLSPGIVAAQEALAHQKHSGTVVLNAVLSNVTEKVGLSRSSVAVDEQN
jgi:hypothetical protein